MKGMKRILSLVIIVALVFSLVGCSASKQEKQGETKPQEEKMVLKLGTAGTLESSIGQGMTKFKEIVEKESNGRITIQIFPGGQLGNDSSLMDSAKMGTVDFCAPSTGPIANITKSFMAFDLPFLLPDEQVADKVLDGPVGQDILKSLDSFGLVGLSFWENGYRNITNSKRPINSAADLNGLKIRTMQNPVHLTYFKSLGANPVPMAYTEVFTALEQKVIDGQENPNTLIVDAGFYEAQKYLTISKHVYTPLVFMASKKTWDKLSAEDQALIKKASVEAGQYERKVNREMDAKALDKMKQAGVAVNELSDEARNEFIKKAQEIYPQYENEIGKDLLKKVMDAIAAAK